MAVVTIIGAGIKYYQIEDVKTAMEGSDTIIGDEIIIVKKPANMPWEAFTYVEK